MGGLKFSEVASLKWRTVLNGKLVLESHRKGMPLGGLVSLKLHEKAHEIIHKYQQKTWSPEDYIFPLLSTNKDLSSDEKLKKQISSKNSSINKLLKTVLTQLEVDKNITFFTARHTFAFLASQVTEDVGALSVVLGHSDVGKTELYLKQINNTQEDDLLLNTFY